MTTGENAAAVRIRAFLDSRQGQTDRFAGTDDAPLTMSDLQTVLDQLDEVRVHTITDIFEWLYGHGLEAVDGTSLHVGQDKPVWISTMAQIEEWLRDQQRTAMRAAELMAGKSNAV